MFPRSFKAFSTAANPHRMPRQSFAVNVWRWKNGPVSLLEEMVPQNMTFWGGGWSRMMVTVEFIYFSEGGISEALRAIF